MRALVLLVFLLFYTVAVSAQDYYAQEYNLNIIGTYGFELFHGGGGVSFVDWNADGLDDLTFATSQGEDPIFFKNTGDGFEEVNPPLVSNTYEHKQIIWIDYDNDGDKDLFISTYDGPNLLYANDGSMNLTDVTASVGLPTADIETFGITFADVTMDGYLDFYQSNHGQNGSAGEENEFYVYDPVSATYTDQTIAAGIGNGVRLSFCSAFFDFDRDNDLDLYVANDKVSQENSLYMNLGGGTFVDVSIPTNTNIAINAMNTVISDYNNDGYFDIYVTNDNTQPAALLENNGNNTFSDVTSSAGVSFLRNGWTGNFIDYDNDEDLDLYVASYDVGINNPSAMYVNDGSGVFTEPFATSGGLDGMDTIGAHVNAYGDFNNDGRLDIAVSRIFEENFSLFSNNEENSNNYIAINLTGVLANRDAYGVTMEVWTNGSSRLYSTHSTHAYLSQNSDKIILPIGTKTAIDSLEIYWPSATGLETILGSDLMVNGINEIEEGSGVTSSYTSKLCLDNHDVAVSPIPSQIYGASQLLTSSSRVVNGSSVEFKSDVEITLGNDFEVEAGAIFTAEISNCSN